MSPLKLYEYLAAGMPVLSVDLPPVRGISDRVLLVDAVADFVDVIDAAIDVGPAPEDERVAFVERELVGRPARARHRARARPLNTPHGRASVSCA